MQIVLGAPPATSKSLMNNQSNQRIQQVFQQLQGRAALIPYVTAGDPSPESTVSLMHALVQAGADIIELGVPFSDPMADGPIIQRAAERALAKGMSLAKVLAAVQDFRKTNQTTPVVLMGYANPVEAMGQIQFVEQAAQAGVDGVLTVDYPPEESQEFCQALIAQGVDPVFLLAPTSTDERIQKIAGLARGYVYYVSLKGVTGSDRIDMDDVVQQLNRIRQYVQTPVGVGFGIRSAERAQQIAQHAEAVIIGSKLIETMEAEMAQSGDPSQAINAAADWLQTVAQALRATPSKS